MATNWPKPGVSHVGEYQASGHALVVTGSANTIYLTHVASAVTVSNHHNADNLNFTIMDSNHEHKQFTVPNDTVARFECKFLTFHVSASMSAIVEVTNIPSASYLIPSASQLHRTTNG